MDLLTAPLVRAGSLLWQPRHGAYRLTVVCKVTVDLLPGECRMAAAQEALHENDVFYADYPELRAPSDMVPFKMRAEVMLVGNAFAPRSEPLRAVVAHVIVAEMDKAIELYGLRASPHEEPQPFTHVSLRYPRNATVGPDGAPLSSSSLEPVGFGPIAPNWPLRASQLGRHAGTFLGTGWNNAPLPDDIELGYFNAAPRDQQVEAIRDNERVVLENLHPEHPLLMTQLPGVRPRAFVERPGRPPEDLPMRGDTLWIDTDRAVATFTFRGQIVLEAPSEQGRVILAVEEPAQRLGWAEVDRLVQNGASDRGSDRVAAAAPTRPAANRFVAHPVPALAPGGGALSGRPPLVCPAAAPVAIAIEEHHQTTVDVTMIRRPNPTAMAPALPFATPDDAVVFPSPSVGDRPTPPRGIDEATATVMPSHVGAMPAWLAANAPSAPPPSAPGSQSGEVSTLVNTTPRSMPFEAPPPSHGGPPPSDDGRDGRIIVDPPSFGIAAPLTEATEVSEGEREMSPDLLELIHITPRAPNRVREEPVFRRLLDQLASPVANLVSDEEGSGSRGLAAIGRDDVYAVLARGEPVDLARLGDWVAHAIGDEGSFKAPLVLVEADLELGFDEAEALRAAVLALSPLLPRGDKNSPAAAVDRALRDAVDIAREWLETRGNEGASSVADVLLSRIREVWARGGRPVPAGYLDAHVARILLERRAYATRPVLGERFLRASLSSQTGGAVPAYLPQALASRLPLFRRFRARVLAEAHPQQDGLEASGTCLSVIALARRLPGVPRTRAS